MTPEEEQARLDTLVAENRMQWVHNEVMDFRRGFIDKLRCPYCSALNRIDTEFCCALMTRAVGAVCDRLDLEERMDAAEAIADKVN